LYQAASHVHVDGLGAGAGAGAGADDRHVNSRTGGGTNGNRKCEPVMYKKKNKFVSPKHPHHIDEQKNPQKPNWLMVRRASKAKFTLIEPADSVPLAKTTALALIAGSRSRKLATKLALYRRKYFTPISLA
jgi:hypothetical protein